jgi:hypothetical protein
LNLISVSILFACQHSEKNTFDSIFFVQNRLLSIALEASGSITSSRGTNLTQPVVLTAVNQRDKTAQISPFENLHIPSSVTLK